MITQSIRSWQQQRGYKPALYFHMPTSVGLFSLTNVEADISTKLEPLEKICLGYCKAYDLISRVELSAITGVSIELCEEELSRLVDIGMLTVSIDGHEIFLRNIEQLKNELDDGWLNTKLRQIIEHPVIRQYGLTADGEAAFYTNTKTIQDQIKLNVMMTTDPFTVFFDSVPIKMHGADDLEVSEDLINRILELCMQVDQGIKPKSIGTNTVLDAKEVYTADYWVSMQLNGSNLVSDCRLQPIVSSGSFERWVTPAWKTKYFDLLPPEDDAYELVKRAISETFVMAYDVIDEGLSYEDTSQVWSLSSDLEMLHMIHAKIRDLIKDVAPEVELSVPKSKWKVVLAVQLTEYDDLASQSLVAGRFYERASRGGFNLSAGFMTYQEMMKDWDRPAKFGEYQRVLDMIVDFGGFQLRLPKIDKLVVDVEQILGQNRRDRQQWQLSRLIQVTELINKAGISNILYVSSVDVHARIDDEDGLEYWLKDHELQVEEPALVHPCLETARQANAFYLGNRQIPKDNSFKDMRIYNRQLRFFIDKNAVKVNGLEPFYDYIVMDLLEAMYNHYYE